ncbi:flavin reductase [Alkaliphilus peptidifermentans]|uniref:NADH-FMN oxidoreductase RutF, flavin reductase (DIM6/NTAB) family n=2 Tax=Alkaliphilus TaxID=114627 RepID=A0A1G5KM26_9FIRM|nr:flavin reductase [Alkaliphilus peptidifermentans]SCZ01665.1 NADH-FMN oxidoreductase RutF, flavin reductase (DIM6/NTAB) family [Alkaliphilus peptidifermentans DSM 18978]
MNFYEIKPEQIEKNTFELIGKDWTLITAEKNGKVNTMTASWGGFGVMWNKNVVFIVIRPQRYTKEFVDASDTFSLTFFEKEFEKELSYLGSVSGRNEDKIAKLNLSIEYSGDTPILSNASLAMICTKLYAQEYKPECFIDTALKANMYPHSDYHTLYIAEVTKVLVKDNR